MERARQGRGRVSAQPLRVCDGRRRRGCVGRLPQCVPIDGVGVVVRSEDSDATDATQVPTAEEPSLPHRQNAADSGLSPAAQSARPASASQEILALLTFSVPTLCIAVTNPLLSLIDTAVVGLSSEVHLAAMAPATMISDSVSYLLTFIPVAVTNLVALRMSRAQYQAAGLVVSQAMVIAVVISGCLATALFCFPSQIIASITALPPDMLGHASEYVRLRALGLPASLCYAVLQAFFLACKEPWIPLRATFIAGAVNALGDLLFCKVFHMGCAGAAAATSIANWMVLILMVRNVQRPLPQGASPYANLKIDVGFTMPSWQVLLTFLGISGPVLGVVFIKTLVFGSIAARAAEISQVTAAAHQILFTLALFFGVFGDTVCQAAQAFLPPLVGQPEKARALGRSLMCCGAIVACFNGLVGTLLTRYFPRIFTNSASVAAAVASVAPLFAIQCIVHCCSMGTEGILLAGRDGSFLMVAYVVNLGIMTAALDIAVRSGWGLHGVWAVCVLFQVVRFVTNSLWLLLPHSALSRTVPIKDDLAAVDDKQLLA